MLYSIEIIFYETHIGFWDSCSSLEWTEIFFLCKNFWSCRNRTIAMITSLISTEIVKYRYFLSTKYLESQESHSRKDCRLNNQYRMKYFFVYQIFGVTGVAQLQWSQDIQMKLKYFFFYKNFWSRRNRTVAKITGSIINIEWNIFLSTKFLESQESHSCNDCKIYKWNWNIFFL